ncbi:oligosaccharide flippase family protein [Candidatus Woesearchaeota archaeon]|nr:oligosaccharide flippase family protein [Candidatus Woesearchaeota archaeon]
MASDTKTILKRSFFIFIIISLTYPFAYITRWLYAKNLTVEEYGLFYAVLGFMNFFVMFRDLGLSETLSRYIPEFNVKKEYGKIKGGIVFVAAVQFLVGLVIVSVLFFSSDLISVLMFKNPVASLMIKIFCILFLIEGFIEVISLTLTGLNMPRYQALSELFNIIFTLIMTFLLFKIMRGAIAPTIAFSVARVLVLIIMVYFIIKNFNFLKYKMILNMNIIKMFFDYSLKLLVGTGAGIILSYFITNMLTIFSGVIHVGIFSVVYPTAVLSLFIVKPFGMILRTYAAEQWAKLKKNKIRDLLFLIYSYLIVFIVPFVFVFFSYPNIIIRIIFGNKFLSYTATFFGATFSLADISMKIILFGMLFTGFASINFAVISAIGKPFEVSKGAYISAVVNLIFSLLFIPRLGVIGAGISLSMSLFSQFLVSLFYLNKFIGIRFPVLRWLKTFFAGFIFLIAISLLKKALVLPLYLEVALALGLSGLLYFLMIFLLRLFKIRDLKFIINAFISSKQ